MSATAIQNYHSLRERKSLTYNEATKRADMLQRYFLSQVKDLRVFKSHYSYFDVTVAKIDRLRTLSWALHFPRTILSAHPTTIAISGRNVR
jgi:hypothetical protein